MNLQETPGSVRSALIIGNIRKANELSSRPYSIEGIVVHGNQLGKTLGFPTANIELPEKKPLLICFGVYLVKARIDSEIFRGIANVGNRPTVDGTTVKIEVHLFDFERDIYGMSLSTYFLDRLRDEKQFSGLTALKEQIKLDKERALSLFNSCNYPDPDP